MSLDGCITAPDGSLDFLNVISDVAAEARKEMEELFDSVDTLVMGRKTFEAGEAMGHGPPPSGPWRTYVMSRSLPTGAGKYGNVFVDSSPQDFIREIRAEPGKNILHMGGGELVRSFLAADLIDELSIGIVPTLLGKGIPLFPAGFPERTFRLVEQKPSSSGVVSLRYERDR